MTQILGVLFFFVPLGTLTSLVGAKTVLLPAVDEVDQLTAPIGRIFVPVRGRQDSLRTDAHMRTGRSACAFWAASPARVVKLS